MAKVGIWEVTQGKGDRMYIKCEREGSISHPGDLCAQNGLLIYGYENLQDLAVAILRFEKEKNENEGILNKV